MSRVPHAVPRLLLGATSLDLPAHAPRDRALEVAGRFREPESLAVTLVKALDAGAEAVHAVPSATLQAAMSELRRSVPVLARLPLTPPAEDLHEDPPLMRPVAGRVTAGSPDLLASVAGALGGGLAAYVQSRCDRDAAGLAARSRRGLVLAAPVTDMALAAGNAKFFERITAFGRARFGGLAGFETRNVSLLVLRLHEWGIEPDFVLGAVNSRGFNMRPDPASVLAVLRRPGIPVIANELRAGSVLALDAGARFALDQGAWGLCPDLIDMDDVAAELRALREITPA